MTKDYYLPLFLLGSAAILLLVFVFYPTVDLIVSGLFYQSEKGFFLADNPVFVMAHGFAYYGSRLIGIILGVMGAVCVIKKQSCFHIDGKGWSFLLLLLLLGPVLIANIGFKDHWGRARPREVTVFGGTALFSPALVPQLSHHKNGSFVSGDGAFGFFFPSFGYVVPRPRSRRAFWSGMAIGTWLGLARIAMGAHFLSDVFFAAVFMIGCSTFLFWIMYGSQALREKWRDWLCST